MTTSYDAQFFPLLFEVEDRHFWFRVRNQVIRTLVQQMVTPLPKGYRVLEVGCGTGNVLRHLEQVCTDGLVIGMDLFSEGLSFARQRVTCPLIQGDMHQPPFSARFDLIGLFDVLEHLPNDSQVLTDLYAMLTSGGRLLLTVPAHQSLWSYFDEAAHHCRRYQKSDLSEKLVKTGFQIEYITYYMASIFPLVWAGRKITALTNQDSTPETPSMTADELATRELKITPGINGILRTILMQETRLIARRKTLPVGTSLLAIATKP